MKFKITRLEDHYVAKVVGWFYTGPRIVGPTKLLWYSDWTCLFNTLEQAESACFRASDWRLEERRRAKWKKIVKF